ncbi:NAD(P)/FAD-dependent oxidoreductase [Niveispirillum sp.]|uniref:NAD(P)/FAD-dependent oxidoreductase n=1 Tax=Niveispirillum sp. TaxID=1917217 RepID=UPI001B3E2F37|nr:NAD(P)/FAD-dependent oxidoreductase [Niveispirillum sp.]MBP7339237.1 NAD(P)/FAD-dependent oxidoreductase [Niveispirillum sp.]
MANDVVVIGGSFAGLSAALQLGRAGRTVLVLDAGAPRNRNVRHSHGLFGLDGERPGKILDQARGQVLSYPTVRVQKAAVIDVAHVDGRFHLSTRDGDRIEAGCLLLATGVTDTLPEIEGLRERWGTSVLHCPYCHGFEFMGKRIGVLARTPMAVHQALLLADWGPVTLFTNGAITPDPQQTARLAARRVRIETVAVASLTGEGEALHGIRLQDGRILDLDVLYTAPTIGLNNGWIAALGCDIDQGPLGPLIRTGPGQSTNVPGLYAAGDCARQPHNATFAAADGVAAAMAIHMRLIEADIQRNLPDSADR